MLVLGGARSGKSRYALSLVSRLGKSPLYIATAANKDEEMDQRIEQHKKSRPEHFRCVEEPINIPRVINEESSGMDVLLIDCLTLWLSNILLKFGENAVHERQDALVNAIHNSVKNIIMVSNEVGMGIVPDNKTARIYRDLAGFLNQTLAQEVEVVVFVAAGLPLAIKGKLPE